MNSIPARIPRLLLLCGSANDGEALNACRAVDRSLKSVGLDWHALAAAIPAQTSGPSVNEDRVRHRKAPAGGVSRDEWLRWRDVWAQHHRPRAFTPRQEATHRAQAKFCREEDRGRLNPRERKFVSDCGKLHGVLSVAQSDWLAGICDRLEQEDRRQWQ